MYIPEKMKINRFKAVAIPSNKAYFSRFGNVSVASGSYTGDDVMPTPQRKIDDINNSMDEFDKLRQEDIDNGRD